MAESKHNLATKGAWVKLRAYTDLRAKHRNRVLVNRVGATKIDPDTGKPVAVEANIVVRASMTVSEDVAAMCITAWNIPYMPGAPLPEDDPDIIGELAIDDYNTLLELTEETRMALLDGPKPVDPGEFADEASPTGPANG